VRILGTSSDTADPAAAAAAWTRPAADSQTHPAAVARDGRPEQAGDRRRFCELGADGRLYNSGRPWWTRSGTRSVYRKAHTCADSRSSSQPRRRTALPTVDTTGRASSRDGLLRLESRVEPGWPPGTAPLHRGPGELAGTAGQGGGGPTRCLRRRGSRRPPRGVRRVDDRCRTERGSEWISAQPLASRTATRCGRCRRPAACSPQPRPCRGQGQAACAARNYRGDRRPESTPGRGKSRVEEATPRTWAARSLTTAKAIDFQATMASITRWDELCRELGPHASTTSAGRGRRGGRAEGTTRGRRCGAQRCVGTEGKFSLPTTRGTAGRADHGGMLPPRRGQISQRRAVRVPYARTLAAYLRIPPGVAGTRVSDSRLDRSRGTAGHRGTHAAPRPRR